MCKETTIITATAATTRVTFVYAGLVSQQNMNIS